MEGCPRQGYSWRGLWVGPRMCSKHKTEWWIWETIIILGWVLFKFPQGEREEEHEIRTKSEKAENTTEG